VSPIAESRQLFRLRRTLRQQLVNSNSAVVWCISTSSLMKGRAEPLECIGNYSAILNNIKWERLSLMGGLFRGSMPPPPRTTMPPLPPAFPLPLRALLPFPFPSLPFLPSTCSSPPSSFFHTSTFPSSPSLPVPLPSLPRSEPLKSS